MKAQEIYKGNSDRKLNIRMPIDLGEELYLHRPLSYAATERETTYVKLLQRTCGPFRSLILFPSTLITNHNGLHDMVSREGICKAPIATQVAPRRLAFSKEIAADPTTEDSLPTLPDKVDCNHQTEFFTNHIVNDRNNPNETRYRERLYGYISQDDIWSPE